jgi:enoyl-CoA hydratase
MDYPRAMTGKGIPAELRALRLDRDGAITTVTMIGPGKGNAMGPDLWRELPLVFRALDRDEDTRVVIVRGLGDHFTYGLDLLAMGPALAPLLGGDSPAKNRTQLLDLIQDLQEATNAVARCRKPVIAAVDGYCLGGGVDLITACDIRLATARATFGVREVRVAMVADLGTLQRLPGIVGEGHARELALTGRDFDGARALRIGLVNDLYDSPEALYEAARALAQTIAENPPLVVEGVKRVRNQATEPRAQAGLDHVAVWNAAFLPSDDLTTAFTAFASRTKPVFKGK